MAAPQEAVTALEPGRRIQTPLEHHRHILFNAVGNVCGTEAARMAFAQVFEGEQYIDVMDIGMIRMKSKRTMLMWKRSSIRHACVDLPRCMSALIYLANAHVNTSHYAIAYYDPCPHFARALQCGLS